MTASYDVIILGGGMAGVSLAAALAPSVRVLLLEPEAHLGSHTTGRSAALFFETYGSPVVRALTRASRAFLVAPPEGFAAAPLMTPRGCLFVAGADELDALQEIEGEAGGAALQPVAVSEAHARVPILAEGRVAGALLDPSGFDIDVAALLQGYTAHARRHGAEILTGSGAPVAVRDGGGWIVEHAAGRARTGVVVNAAGAWADRVAERAGVAPIGLVPMRRTALLVSPPAGLEVGAWPMVITARETLYFKPDAGRLLISPANEDPEEPGDAAPDEMDVAIAVDRFETLTTMSIRRIEHKWSGQRTFAPDRSPVVGFDREASGFFWLVGQGGYGIQTAPAMAATAAGLILEGAVPTAVSAHGVSEEALSPKRAGLR